MLQLALGTTAGLHLDMVLHIALASAGAYVLGRVAGLGRLGALAPALIYPWSSSLYLHLAEGHGWALTYADAPWAVAAAYYAMDKDRPAFAALAGLILGLMINEGGIYPAPHVALLVGLLGLYLAIARRSVKPLLLVALVGVVGFLFAGAKLLPTYELMKHDPRKVASSESTGWAMLRDALFSRNQSRYRPMPHDRWYWGYQEYGDYLGVFGAVVALLGLLAPGRGRRWPWVLCAAVFLSLGLGDFGVDWAPKSDPDLPLSPWAVLHHLPLFSSQHVPSRFLPLFTLPLGVVAGFGAEWAASLRPPWAGRAVALWLLLGAADAQRVSAPNMELMFQGTLASFPRQETFRQVWDVTDRRMYPLALANLGAVHCYEYSHLATAALAANRPGYRGEEWMEGPGTVALTRWSPNELEYEVDAPAPTVVAINQNYDVPWTLVQGQGEVFADEGRIGLRLPAGKQHLVLAYRSKPFRLGLLMSLAGLALAGALAWRERRRAPSPAPAPSSSPA